MEAVDSGDNHSFLPLTNRRLFAFFAMIIGMFMAILDIQIVASSISVIGAGLNASNEELAWIQTSYLIAEVIVIPMTGYFVRMLSTRIVYSVATFGFTIASILCSIAWNIESMIIFRAIQGFCGGAMIPTVFATSFMIFSKEQRPIASIFIGLVASVAPTIGPTIGGYITDAISWHFMFLLNVIPGIFVIFCVLSFVDFDEADYSLRNNFDYIGVMLLAVSLASLQYILEEGNLKGWFDDELLLFLLFIVIIGSILFIWRESTYSNPILDLRAFYNSNFTIGCIFSSIVGAGLYGSVYLMPLFLSRIVKMNTYDIGIIMMVTGVFQFLSAPIAGRLFKAGIDSRIMLAIGLILYATGLYMNSFLTSESRYSELFWPQAVRGISLMFCFIPVNNVALDTIPRHMLQNASGLYNLMRNLGGAFGLAMLNSYINNNTVKMESYLSEYLSNTKAITQGSLQNISNMLSQNIATSETASYGILKLAIVEQAFIISLNNSYILLGAIFAASLFPILLIKPDKSNAS